MARPNKNGNGRLDEAMTALAQAHTSLAQAQVSLVQAQAAGVLNQTALAQNQTAFLARMAEIDAQRVETDRINGERFARIEALLMEHSRILRALPDVIRDKIGFKGPEPRPAE
jgi:hypothetical protein